MLGWVLGLPDTVIEGPAFTVRCTADLSPIDVGWSPTTMGAQARRRQLTGVLKLEVGMYAMYERLCPQSSSASLTP